MTSFHQNQSPPISGIGEGAEGKGIWEGVRAVEGGRRAWLAGPPAGQKGGKNGFHTRKSIRAGTVWSWQHRAAAVFLKIPH